jgi:hypothetical protein
MNRNAKKLSGLTFWQGLLLPQQKFGETSGNLKGLPD